MSTYDWINPYLNSLHAVNAKSGTRFSKYPLPQVFNNKFANSRELNTIVSVFINSSSNIHSIHVLPNLLANSLICSIYSFVIFVILILL